MTVAPPSDAGFSLLEALVAASLTAMLGLLLFGGVNLGVRVMDRSAVKSEQAAEIAVATSFLQRHLARAQPAGPGAGTGESAFAGDAHGLTFVEIAATPGFAGPARLRLRTEQGTGGLQLVATWEPLRGGDGVPPHRSVLLEKLASVEFAYFGGGEDGSPDWSPSWQGPAALPSLVRMRVRLHNRQTPLETLVALRLAAAPTRFRGRETAG